MGLFPVNMPLVDSTGAGACNGAILAASDQYRPGVYGVTYYKNNYEVGHFSLSIFID